MAGLFRKRKKAKKRHAGEILDLVDLQKRGLLKKSSAQFNESTGITTDSYGYADLTKRESESGSSGAEGNTMDFFSSISSSINSNPGISDNASGSYARNHGFGSQIEADVNQLKNNIEDIEFKLDSMTRKINDLIERMELSERRLDRAEGRNV